MSTRFTRTRSLRTMAMLAFGIFVVGCLDKAVTGPGNSDPTAFAARLVVLDGNSQTGPVNRALTSQIKLRVTDVNGSPVAGATVNFAMRQGGGSVNPATVRSSADGTVNATWTMGTTLGAQKVVAILTGQWVVDSTVLTATATNGAASKISVDAGDNQRATIGNALPQASTVLVTDDYGNPVPGAEVTFRVSAGGGRVDLLRTTTDGPGKLSVMWTLGTLAGSHTMTASLANGQTTSFRATADAGSPVQLTLESAATQTGTVGRALSTPVSVRVVDAYGNYVRGASVSWAAEDGSIAAITSTTDSLGRSQARWTLGNKTGTQNASASVSGAPGISVVALAQAGTATTVNQESGDKQTQTVRQTLPLPLVGRVVDQYGNGVAGVPVTWAAATGGGTLLGTSATTDAYGRATALWTLGAPVGSQMATLAVPGMPLTVYTATALVASGDSLAIETGNNQTGPTNTLMQSPLVVRVRDLAGNPVPGSTVVFAVASGGGSVLTNMVITDVNGRASTTWTLGSALGIQTATATSGTRSVTFSATALPGTPTTVTVETGDKQTGTVKALLPLPLVARILDKSGLGVSGVTVTWTPASGGGTLLATSASTDATGRATAYWTLGPSSGSQLATMAVSGLPLTVFSATAAAATGDSVVIEAGNNQSATVSTMLSTPLIVRVRDKNGNPSVGTTVIFSATSGGGSVVPSVVVTDANGRASASWTLGSFAGAQTATATIGSQTLNFVATGAAVGGGGGGGGALTPSQIVLVSGNGQTGTVSQTLASAVVVRVVDASGIPVSGVNVTWTLAGANNGGLASPAISRTDGSGDASLLWTLGSKVGLQQVTASVTGLTSVTLSATAQIGSTGAVIVDNGNGQTGAIGAALATYLRVLVVDQSGTAVSSARVNWSVATGGGSLSKSSGTTGISGLDSLVWTLGTSAGAQSVTATVTGVGSVSFSATASGSIVVDAGNSQSGNVNTVLGSYLRVKVVGPTGTAIPNISVNWAVTAGGGILSKSQGLTNASGLDSAQLTLGAAAGANTVSATVTGLGTVTFSSTATSTAASAASIVKISGDLQTGRANTQLNGALVVEVRNTSGAPITGATVTFASPSSPAKPADGVVDSTVVVTGLDGRARTRWTLGANSSDAVTTATMRATVQGTAFTQDFTASVRPTLRIRRAPTSILPVGVTNGITQSDTTGATLSDTLQVQVYDPSVADVDGPGVAGTLVQFMTGSEPCAEGYAVNDTNTTNSLGIAKSRWVLKSPALASSCPGSQQLSKTLAVSPDPIAKRMRATSAGALGEVEFQAYVSAGRVSDNFQFRIGTDTSATSISTTFSIATLASRTQLITITVRDGNGYYIPGATVTLTPAGTDAVGTTTMTTAADGTVSTTWVISATTGEHRLTVFASKAATPYAGVFNATKDWVIKAVP